MTTLRQAAQNVVEVWKLYGTAESLRGWMGILEAALAEPTMCAWHGDEDGSYETSCKHIFQMIDGTPQENKFTHCCFCGKPLAQHLWEEDDNDD